MGRNRRKHKVKHSVTDNKQDEPQRRRNTRLPKGNEDQPDIADNAPQKRSGTTACGKRMRKQMRGLEDEGATNPEKRLRVSCGTMQRKNTEIGADEVSGAIRKDKGRGENVVVKDELKIARRCSPRLTPKIFGAEISPLPTTGRKKNKRTRDRKTVETQAQLPKRASSIKKEEIEVGDGTNRKMRGKGGRRSKKAQKESQETHEMDKHDNDQTPVTREDESIKACPSENDAAQAKDNTNGRRKKRQSATERTAEVPGTFRINTRTLALKQRTWCEHLVEEIISWPLAAPFTRSVEKLLLKGKLPGYSNVVQIPMDFGMILRKLRNGDYRERACGGFDFVFFSRDIRLVFENCLAYSHPHSEEYMIAPSLLDTIEDKLRTFPSSLENTARKDEKGAGWSELVEKLGAQNAKHMKALEILALENELKHLTVKHKLLSEHADEIELLRHQPLDYWERDDAADAVEKAGGDAEKMWKVCGVISRQVFDAIGRGIEVEDCPDIIDVDFDVCTPYEIREVWDICDPDRSFNLMKMREEIKELEKVISNVEVTLKEIKSQDPRP